MDGMRVDRMIITRKYRLALVHIGAVGTFARARYLRERPEGSFAMAPV
jgi:hypothetical protein